MGVYIKTKRCWTVGFLCVLQRGWGCLSFHTTEGGVGWHGSDIPCDTRYLGGSLKEGTDPLNLKITQKKRNKKNPMHRKILI